MTTFVRAFVVFAAFGLLATSGPQVRSQPPDKKNEKSDKAWEVVRLGAAGIAAPQGWRNIPSPSPRIVLYRQGDGIGVPVTDDTGAPLQIGITVEKYPDTKDSLAEGAKRMLDAAKRNPRLDLIGKEMIEDLTLSDGSDGKLLVAEFIKEKTRRSLQMKMLVKDAESNGWVITGYIVGGKESKMSVASSDLAMWLRAHMTSFCLDATKVDEAKVKDADDKRAK